MGGPYNIPRNYKGESKILFVFSTKSFVYTGVGALIGILLYYILKMIGLSKLGLACVIIFAALGFIIGTCKVPESSRFELTQKTGGEPIDQVILRWIKFKRNKKKIYIYEEGVHEDVK